MYCYTMYWYTKVLVCKGIGMQRSSFASSKSLNPLKRVNSILTAAFSSDCGAKGWKGKKDSDGKKVVEGVGGIFFDLI